MQSSEFGRSTARWRPDCLPSQTGLLAAAWFQHRYVLRARTELNKRYKDGSLVQFASELHVRFEVGDDPQTIQRKFSGARRAHMEDYLLWSQVLGARCLYVVRDRKDALPPPDQIGPEERRL